MTDKELDEAIRKTEFDPPDISDYEKAGDFFTAESEYRAAYFVIRKAARELSQLRDGTHPDMVMVPRDTVMNVFKACWSHVDGRNYFTELKPRKTLDILKRIDGKETWHEGDWLTGLGEKLSKLADSVLAAAPKGNAK